MINYVYELLINQIGFKKDRIAFRNDEMIKTYAEMVSDVGEYSDKLKSLGINRNSRIGIQLQNSYDFIKVFFSLQKIGCTVVLINYDSWEKNVLHISRDSQLSYIISDSQNYVQDELVKLNLNCEDIENIQLSNHQDYPDKLESSAISDDVALIIYTSGTTGSSKGVILTHKNVISGTEIVSTYLNIESQDCILGLLPFSFDYGLNQLLSAVFCGATIYVKYPVNIFQLPKIIQKEKITGVAGVPSIWINLLNLNYIRDYDFKHLKYITNSGGAIPSLILEQMADVFKYTKIYLMYGLTECFRCSFLSPDMYMIKKGSLGKAIPGCEIMLLNEEGNKCKTGEVGQIVFRGPTVGKGYLNNEEATKKVYRDNPFNIIYRETVVYSGDYAYSDDEGYLYFAGRKDEQLKKNGYRFNTEELINEIYKCSSVLECCIVARKNEMMEDDIYVFAKLADNCEALEFEKSIYNELINDLPSYIKPQRVIVLDEIPKQYNSKYSYVELNKILDRILEK